MQGIVFALDGLNPGVVCGRAPIVVSMEADSRAGRKGDAVPEGDEKRAAHRALVDRVLNGEGTTSPELRAGAFRNRDLPESLHALIDTVSARPAQVTDADIAAARASGFSEDQIFELVISAAVGQSARRYEAGLAALAEATAAEEAG